MEFPNARIIVFAKAPQAGRVKTRLIPHIGAQAATELHQRLVLNTLQQLHQTALCPVELWCAPDSGHPFFSGCQQHFDVTLHTQCGDDLGMRMHHALNNQPEKPTLLIGSDVPAVDADYLRQGLLALMRGERWVLGPAEDGGYVLVGCCMSDRRFFENIQWGTSEVLEQTLRNALGLGHQPYCLDTLWDLDEYQDLQRWEAMGE